VSTEFTGESDVERGFWLENLACVFLFLERFFKSILESGKTVDRSGERSAMQLLVEIM
jgi:hypothetical protein